MVVWTVGSWKDERKDGARALRREPRRASAVRGGQVDAAEPAAPGGNQVVRWPEGPEPGPGLARFARMVRVIG
jgi:hypothetical protein